MKNQPRLAITAILAAAVLAGIFAMVTTSIKINAEEDYGDSETETEQKNKQSTPASGFNVNVNNCAENNIESPHATGISNYPHCTQSLFP
jgi:FlaG/FlaF family flagellin (archaellin)